MPTVVDILNNDAFSVTTLTAGVQDLEHVPGRAGELVFEAVGQGVTTTTIAFELKGDSLTLLSSQPRGGTGDKQTEQKRKVVSLPIPHIPDYDTILADKLVNVRQFGSNDQMAGVQQVIEQSNTKMFRNHDLTLEHLRLGALKGQVIDGDGNTVLADLFATFGVSQEAEVDFELDDPATDLRGKCSTIIRKMKTNAKTVIPSGAHIHSFVDAAFMDMLLNHAAYKEVGKAGAENAKRMLADSYVYGAVEFGGIIFEEYQGGGGVAIDANKAQFFWSGVPGLYAEYYAPADYMETVGTVGLPRYSKPWPLEMNKGIKLETQQNPLPICLRPKTLMRAKKF